MSLAVVSTPIGRWDDITLHAIDVLKNADVIFCEEMRPASTLLKKIGVGSREILELNEHSSKKDVEKLADICFKKSVALISDCGSPGFCDPGAELVSLCYSKGIEVRVVPGPSSLMALISISGLRLDSFYFAGFLPAEKNLRRSRIEDLRLIRVPLVFMDTPYRLASTLRELAVVFPNRYGVLGVDLTGEKHQVLRGRVHDLSEMNIEKLPFVLIIGPEEQR